MVGEVRRPRISAAAPVVLLSHDVERKYLFYPFEALSAPSDETQYLHNVTFAQPVFLIPGHTVHHYDLTLFLRDIEAGKKLPDRGLIRQVNAAILPDLSLAVLLQYSKQSYRYRHTLNLFRTRQCVFVITGAALSPFSIAGMLIYCPSRFARENSSKDELPVVLSQQLKTLNPGYRRVGPMFSNFSKTTDQIFQSQFFQG